MYSEARCCVVDDGDGEDIDVDFRVHSHPVHLEGGSPSIPTGFRSALFFYPPSNDIAFMNAHRPWSFWSGHVKQVRSDLKERLGLRVLSKKSPLGNPIFSLSIKDVISQVSGLFLCAAG